LFIGPIGSPDKPKIRKYLPNSVNFRLSTLFLEIFLDLLGQKTKKPITSFLFLSIYD
jgi:hypothetical protein